MINAVYESKIERSYRLLAVTLAHFADDTGRDVFPGASKLARATGLRESTIRHGLQALVTRQVLVYDGFHGHTRRFRFDLERLATYRPEARASRRGGGRRDDGTLPPTAGSQPDSDATTLPRTAGLQPDSDDGTLPPSATNPAAHGHQPCRARPVLKGNTRNTKNTKN